MVETPTLAQVIILNKLMDSDDEKPHRGKTWRGAKRRSNRGYFNNIINELRVEDRTGFRDMFRMDVADFEYILTQISGLILPKHKLGGTDPITSCLCLKTDFFVLWLWKKHSNVRNMLHCRFFALSAMLKDKVMDENGLKCIQHENIVGWTRKC